MDKLTLHQRLSGYTHLDWCMPNRLNNFYNEPFDSIHILDKYICICF